jgi:microcystin-dependent protein
MAAGIESWLSEVAIVPFNFAPSGWALCQGQLLSISANTALFSLLGTQYGGNGTSTFGLPNMNGAVLVGSGISTADGNNYYVGQTGGAATTTLTTLNLPAHTHATTNPLGMPTGSGGANTHTPVDHFPAQGTGNLYAATSGGASNIPMDSSAVTVGPTGGGVAYSNLQAYLGMYFVIAQQGIFPPRS